LRHGLAFGPLGAPPSECFPCIREQLDTIPVVLVQTAHLVFVAERISLAPFFLAPTHLPVKHRLVLRCGVDRIATRSALYERLSIR
jgi:hypothetical protein